MSGKMDLRPSYAATARFLRGMIPGFRHTEAVAECPHCNLNYAATVLERLADHPADDSESVTEEWLSKTFGPHLASCPWKRYAMHFATTKGGRLCGWCPPCGDLPACLCVDRLVMTESPTRGDVRLLLKALGTESQSS